VRWFVVDEKKAAIVILVLIGILFAVILLASSSNKQKDQANLDQPFSFAFLDRFTTKRKVLPAELGVSGGGSFAVPASSPFTATIPEAKGVLVRTMALQMTHGAQMTIELEPKGDYGVDVKVTLKLKPPPGNIKTPSLQVFEGGAVLTATCVEADPILKTCSLQLMN
jgi:hypothetical protein